MRKGSAPYHRITFFKTRPVSREGIIVRLQQRCRRHGADEAAIDLLGKTFANEVSLGTLIRPLTDAEPETEFGTETGKVYIAPLESTNDEEGGVPRHICRLCQPDMGAPERRSSPFET
jgi:hypothetical protein